MRKTFDPRPPAPPLDDATGWLQSEALDWEKAHDRLAPRGFVVVGVHAPEFAAERARRNVEDAMWRHRLEYPVAMDNDHAVWRA